MTLRHSTPLLRVLVLSGALLGPVVPIASQEPGDQEPAIEWPELDRKTARRVDQLAQTLRHTKKQERRDEAEAELITIGAGAAPILLKRFSDHESAAPSNASLCRVLDDVTTAEHAPLLTPLVKSRVREVRAWLVTRLTAFGREDLRPAFRDLAADKDPEIAFRARLGLASTGDLGELDAILARTREDWDATAPLLPAALAPARSAENAQRVLEVMRDADDRTRVAGLRLLRWLMPADSARSLLPWLDAEDHAVKKAAINALRVAVDGAAPQEKLAVFSAIEQAKKWKERLQ